MKIPSIIHRGRSPGRSRSDLLSRLAFSRDAGFYRLVPQQIVHVSTLDSLLKLFESARRSGRHIVFRGAGTSLSGQAISDDILVDLSDSWSQMEILEDGRAIRCEPGVMAARANQVLKSYGYRLGPDPGSIKVARIGGIIANNASGIGSGVKYNSYHTLKAMEMVLPNGLVLNTANPQDDEKFHHHSPEIYTGLLAIRSEILGDQELLKRIRSKYAMKNTVGYGLNSFVDFERPIEILAHLMVGSEGTLGFISSVTLDTIALKPLFATALLYFNELSDAAEMVQILKPLDYYACEILDRSALDAVGTQLDLPEEEQTQFNQAQAALLIEFQSQDDEDLTQRLVNAETSIARTGTCATPQFSKDPERRTALWRIRRELGPIHAASRKSGTTLLSEDVCFKVKDLALAIKDLQFLFKHHGYDDAIIFGHAGDGNLHFKLSLDLSADRSIDNYGVFISDLVDMVVNKYDGSLKAEHGTGRNMAPFVETEWGPRAYDLMCRVKQLLDPQKLLNPEVIISSDSEIHLKHIKPIPRVNTIIDPCIECGLCEPVCPSSTLTLTPRQRIVIKREMASMDRSPEAMEVLEVLEREYRYAGEATCAADGLCALACPVSIDTGAFIKIERAKHRGRFAITFSLLLRRRYAELLQVLRLALIANRMMVLLLTRKGAAQTLARLNAWSGHRIPVPGSGLRAIWSLGRKLPRETNPDVIYFPSCISRTLAGSTRTKLDLGSAFLAILETAKIKASMPARSSDLCCGLTFSSKGFSQAAYQSAVALVERLWMVSDQGKVPIVMDTSPCTHHIQHLDHLLSGIHLAQWRALKILDAIDFLHDSVIDRLTLTQLDEKIMLHPACAVARMGIVHKLKAIAGRCARDVEIPEYHSCCGAAGDRGMFFPELPRAATRDMCREIRSSNASAHYSSSRTCELNLSDLTAKEYESIIYLVHRSMTAPAN